MRKQEEQMEPKKFMFFRAHFRNTVLTLVWPMNVDAFGEISVEPDYKEQIKKL